MKKFPWFAAIAFSSGVVGFLWVYEGPLRAAITDPVAWLILAAVGLGTAFWLAVDGMRT